MSPAICGPHSPSSRVSGAGAAGARSVRPVRQVPPGTAQVAHSAGVRVGKSEEAEVGPEGVHSTPRGGDAGTVSAQPHGAGGGEEAEAGTHSIPPAHCSP